MGNTIMVNGAWYIDNMTDNLILELQNGVLGMIKLSPLRIVTEDEICPYKGHHPRKIKGSPLPDYLYRFYGMTRNEATLSEVIRVRVSPSEKEKLEAMAENDGKTVSEFLRDYIRSL